GFTNPAIVHSGAGTLRQGSATSFTSFNQSSGTMDLNGYDLATTGDFTLSNGTSVSFAGLSGSTLNIGGNASISGASAASKTNLDPANAWSLNVAGTLNANLASLAHSDASGSTSTGICGDCANVTGNSNWNFATVWKGAGPDGNWSTALNWGSQSVPTAGENVVFNSTSVKDVLLDVDAEVNSISLNTGYTGNLDFTTHTLTINGNADFDGGETITPGTGTLAFTGSAAQTFQAGNATNFPGIVVGGAVGTTLTSALAAGNLTLASGSLNLGTGFIHSFADVSGSGSLDFNGSELDARGNVDLSGLTVTATSANILAFTGNGSQAFTPKASMTALKLSKTGSGITTVTGYGFTTPLMTLANGTLQLGSDLNHTAADLALTGGSLNMGSARLSTPAGTVDFSNLTAITFPTGNSALEFTGNSAQTFITKIGLTFPSIIQNGAGGTTVVTNNPIAKKLSLISGTLHLGSSRRFTVSDSLVALGGGLDFGTSATLVFGGAAFDMQPISPMTAGTGSLEFNGTNPQTYTPKVSATHPALNVSGNGGTTILANGLQTSSIQVANGTLHLGTNLVHTTYGFTGTSGGLDFGSSTLEYSGAGINLALLTTVTPGTGKLRFTGASATLQPHATDTLPDIQQSATGTTTVITNGLKTGSLSPLSGSFHFGSGLNHSIGSIFMGAGSAGPNGSLDFGSSEVHISADADLGSLTALTPGSGKLYFDAATGTQIFVPKAGGSAHPPVYHTGAGTLRLATNNLACAAFTQSAGALDLNGNNLTTSGGFTVTNGSPASFANLGGRTLTVGGNASLTGTSSASRLGMGPTSAWTLAVTGALTAAFVNLAFNTASLTPGTCTGCVDAGSNNNWVFPVEWDGGGPNGNWSTALNWSSDQVPGPTDIISFNATNRNATLDVDVTVKDITFTGAYTGNFDFASHALSLSGNSDFRSGGAIIPGNGSLALIGTGAHSLIPKSGGGLPIINQNGPGKTTIAVLPLASAGILLSSGTLDLGANFIHATGPVSGTGTLDFNSSTLRVSGNFNVSSANVVPGSGNLEFIGASAKTFSPKAAAAYPAITQSGTGGLVVSGNGFTAPYLSLSAGTLSLGSGLTHVLTTGLSLTGGILDFGSSTLKTSATTVDLSGLDSVSGGSGYLEFTRSSAQTFTPKAGDPHPALIQSGNGTTTFAKALNSVPRLTVAAGGVNLGAGWTHSVGEIATTGGSLDFGASTLEASGLNADFSGLGTMTASSGTLRFTAATGNQTLSARAGQNHPAIEHIGAGLLILNAADLLCASFRQTAGRLDLNGRDITVSTGGFFDILNGNSGTLLNLSGRTLTVGGDAKLLGLKTDHLNLDPNSAWIIFVEGSLKAVHSNLKNCIATEMAGLADSSLNLGGNVNWTFLDTIKPDNVTGFVARALGGHSVELTWTAPTAADADSVMLRYRTDGVEPQNPGDGILWRTVPVAKTADTATGTPEKTVFHFAAFARDSSGNYALGNGENADSAFTPDVTAPAGILAFTATGLTATATSLDWTPSAASDADTLVIRYRTDGAYPVNETDGSLWKKLSAQATADTVTGLANNTVYHFGAFVRDTSGNFSPGTAAARDTALYQIPVLGGIAIGDAAGRTADVDPALLLTWSGADSLRVSLIADTAAALWTGLRAADSLSLASGADGMRILMAQFKNLYGSRSAWYRDTTLLDRTAPVANLKLDTVHSWRNWPNSVSGSALDAIAGTDSVWMIRSREADGAYFNGTGWTTVADTARFRADSAFSAPMPNSAMATGYYNITVSARDKLGNRSAPLTIRVKYQENRAPVAAASTVADTALQNQQVSWKIDFGEYDAGDSVFTAAANIPAWLTLTQTPGPAEGGFAAHRIYVLAGKPLQSDVGNATVTVQVRDAGGMTFTYSKSFAVIDVNDPPVFTAGQDYFGAKEDSVSRFIPRYADADPKDRHSLALLEAPAWVMIADSALEFKPGSRDVGPAVVRATVSDGMLLDTLELKVNVANMNDPPFAFPSANWQMMARWKEDVADSFSVVVVDLDQGDNISLATVLPAWITYQGTIDPVEGFNRFFRFAVKPTQADTGAFSLKLRFQDAAGAFSELPLTAKVTAVNDVPTALILGQENQAGAARIALDVTDQDGNTASTRFHYRLIGASGDTLRRGICPTALLSLHPLADGDYRLAVSAEDEEGLRQPGFTIANVRISGATNLFLDTARWHMIAYPGRGLSAGALGAGAALTTWDESAGDGSPLGRYAIGKSADSLARGKGYWVRVAKPVTVGAPFPELLDKPYTMRLTHGKQGWNQVGNPFPYFVDLSKTGLTWWEWDSERRDLVNAKGILKPWSAYWVQVAKDTVLTIKDQPYFSVGAVAGGGDRALAKSGNSAAAPTPASHHGSEASAGWTLQMALQAGCYQDQANFLGVRDVTGLHAGAVNAPGSAGQIPDAPKFGDYVALHFGKPGDDAYRSRAVAAAGTGFETGMTGEPSDLGYAEDFRPRMGEDEEWWDFTVENSGTGFSNAELSLPGLGNLEALGLHAFLVRKGKAFPLAADSPATLHMEGVATYYSLVVTPHADFTERLKGNFSISQNFPNPVRTFTSFRFVLPQTWDAAGKRETTG
ncbi:MAG: hypothetical protein ABIW76_18945, partial [Fibrobacteria bacterium]